MYQKIMGLVGILILVLGMESYPEKQESKAKEMVLQSLEKMAQTKGYHFETKFTIEVNQADGKNLFKFTCTMKEGVHLSPDMAYGRFAAMGHKSEVYQRANKVVAKGVKGDKWVKGNPIAYPLPSEQWKILTAYLEDAKFSGKEKVQDKECQIIEVSIKPEGVIKILRQLTFSIPKGKTPISSYKIWVGEKDSFVYKLFSSIEIPPPTTKKAGPKKKGPSARSKKIITEIDFFDYNKDIEIKIPKEVKELLEMVSEEKK